MIGFLILFASIASVLGRGIVDTNESSRLSEITKLYYTRSSGQDIIGQFYDAQSTLTCQSQLPWGQMTSYVGPSEMRLFTQRIMGAATILDMKYRIVGLDTARGVSIADINVTGTFRKTQQPFHMEVTDFVQWNMATGKVMHQLVNCKNKDQVLKAYRTRAEKLLNTLIATYYHGDSFNTKSKIWDLLSDDITMRVSLFPSHLLNRTEWNGKGEVQEFFADRAKVDEEGGDKDEDDRRHRDAETWVIFSNEDEALRMVKVKELSLPNGKILRDFSIFQHFRFDDAGLLKEYSISFSRAFEPYEILQRPKFVLTNVTTTTNETNTSRGNGRRLLYYYGYRGYGAYGVRGVARRTARRTTRRMIRRAVYW